MSEYQESGWVNVDIPVLEKDEELEQVDHIPEVFEPVSQEDVAEELDMKPDAVRQSLTRLRKRLKECIEQEMSLKKA